MQSCSISIFELLTTSFHEFQINNSRFSRIFEPIRSAPIMGKNCEKLEFKIWNSWNHLVNCSINQSWLFLIINIEFSSNKECLEMNPNKPICRQNNCQHECTHLVPCPGGKSCVDGRYKLVHVLLYDIFVPYFGWWKLSKQTFYWSKTGFFFSVPSWKRNHNKFVKKL